MFKTYQKYLALHLLPPLGMSIFFFTSFLITTQLFKFMRIVTKKGVEISVFFELLGHMAMSFLPMALPLSLLFSLIYTMNKLSEDSEIVAMRAMGLSKSKLLLPFMVIGLICAVTIFSLKRNLIPTSELLFKNTIISLSSKGFLADIKKEQFYTDIPGVTLFAENVSEDGKTMDNIFIKLKSSAGKDKVIMGKKGVLIKDSKSSQLTLNLKLDLYDGNIISINNDGDEVEKILFDKYEFPIVSSSSGNFINTHRMKSNKELLVDLDRYEQRVNQAKKEKNPKKVLKIKKNMAKAQLEYWTRFNIPFQCLAFILMGFVFGIKKGRGKSKNTTVTALIMTILYYIILFVGISFVKKATYPAYMAIFTPTIIISIISYYYYRKIDWAS